MLKTMYVLIIVLASGQNVTLGTYQNIYECDKQGMFYKFNGAGQLGRITGYECMPAR